VKTWRLERFAPLAKYIFISVRTLFFHVDVRLVELAGKPSGDMLR
jgi:hypothetical protein